MRIGASISSASTGRFMQLVASVSITSTPSRAAEAPLPPAISSPTTKRRPRCEPPKARVRSSPAASAGTRSGSASLKAPRMQPVMRLIVAVREPTGAGSHGFTSVPSGRWSDTGRKQPALVGIVGSVRARTAK